MPFGYAEVHTSINSMSKARKQNAVYKRCQACFTCCNFTAVRGDFLNEIHSMFLLIRRSVPGMW